ncbi:hypothetical protein [Candidatus Magnetaquicoccus inordinatus]|uniref:hypothetical protein n=1 Tax=Candidatus Magnetaquicoccus inordinatus TaxID=2496818 RepID=UPI00102C0379|nr:hypothetical protein [Candidatus Magnetaquicoccus inordinatus]
MTVVALLAAPLPLWAAPEWGINYYRVDPPRGESFSVDPKAPEIYRYGERFMRPDDEESDKRSSPAGRQPRYWSHDNDAERSDREYREAEPPPGREIPNEWRNEDLNRRMRSYPQNGFSNSAPRATERNGNPLWYPSDRELARDRWRWEAPPYPAERESSPRTYDAPPPYEYEPPPASGAGRRYPPNGYQNSEQWWERR